MICSNCQAETPEYPFCPYCGHRLHPADPSSDKQARRGRRKRFMRRWVLPFAILITVTAFGVLGMAALGFRAGVQDRDRANRHQAEVLYNRGLVYLEWGQYQLAEAHFEEALQLVPDYAEAADKLQVAQVKQTVTPSPTPVPPTHTPVPPTPTPIEVVVPLTDVLYKEGRSYYDQQAWQMAIGKLEQLQLEDANYRAQEVSEILFECHLQYGMALDAQDEVEAAIMQYDRALALRPRDPQVSELRRRADLYQSALNDWGVNWERVVDFMSALYHLAPDYKDTTERLYQASLEAGEKLIKQEQYCAASEMFEQALKIHSDDETVVKREADTSFLCQVVTPVPLGTPTPDGPASPWSRVHIGTLLATCYDPHRNQYDICAQNTEDNVLETWIEGAEQPAVTLDGKRLAYRSSSLQSPGLYAMDLISGTVVTVTKDANAYYPTWSPDGTQVAYMQYDAEQKDWFIYIARPDTGTPPQRFRKGEWPDWGPNGLLAFTTCSQENHCGIYVYNLFTGEARQLTHSKQDRAAAWSPSGSEIAYMSDIGLSFNLHVVIVQEGTVRQITKNLFTDVLPVWSPDGQRIAFVTNHSDDWSIYSIHPWPGEGQAERVLTLGPESGDWQRFQLAWTAAVLHRPEDP